MGLALSAPPLAFPAPLCFPPRYEDHSSHILGRFFRMDYLRVFDRSSFGLSQGPLPFITPSRDARRGQSPRPTAATGLQHGKAVCLLKPVSSLDAGAFSFPARLAYRQASRSGLWGSYAWSARPRSLHWSSWYRSGSGRA